MIGVESWRSACEGFQLFYMLEHFHNEIKVGDSKSTETHVTDSHPSYLKEIHAASCSPVPQMPASFPFGSEMAEKHIHLD